MFSVCTTTGKRKACKDCTCGLAEELSGSKAAPESTVKSSCGSVRSYCFSFFEIYVYIFNDATILIKC